MVYNVEITQRSRQRFRRNTFTLCLARMATCIVRLVHKESLSRCALNVDFGCNTRIYGVQETHSVWVTNGCRGTFSVHLGDEQMLLPCGSSTPPIRHSYNCSIPFWAPAVVTEPGTRRQSLYCAMRVGYRPGACTRWRQYPARSAVPDASAGGYAQPHLHGHYYEGVRAIATSYAPTPRDVAALQSMKLLWHEHRVAAVLDTTLDNLFHVIFNAVPTLDTLARHDLLSGNRTDFLPRFTSTWPPPPQDGREYWPGWEVYIRAVVGSANNEKLHFESIAKRAKQLLKANDCGLKHQPKCGDLNLLHCYRTMVGGHARWWPSGGQRFSAGSEAFVAARPRMAAFRAAVMATVPPPKESTTYLAFELRQKTRAIINADSLKQAVEAIPGLRGRIRFVSLATLPIVEQLSVVGHSAGLVGAHGAALAFVIFLPTHRWNCSVLELRMRTMQRTHARFDYPRLSMMSNVRYRIISNQTDAPECVNQDFRTCGNFSVDVSKVTERLGYMLAPDRLAWS